MNKIITVLFVLLTFTLSSQSLGKERVDRLKSSVVRILIDGQPSGTGFFINDEIVITCFHVAVNAIVTDSMGKFLRIKSIKGEFSNGENPVAFSNSLISPMI